MKPNYILEDVKCPMCDMNRATELYIGKDRLFKKEGEFKIVECNSCGLLYTNPRPTQDTIGYFYPDDYGPYNVFNPHTKKIYQNKNQFFTRLKNEIKYQILMKYFGYKTLKPPTGLSYFDKIPYPLKFLIIKISMPYFRKIYTRIPFWHEEGKALEIGCGNGAILLIFKNLGWDVTGIDVNVQVADEVKEAEIPVFSGQLDEMNFKDNSFHLITMWHVIEHLPEPLQSLKDIYRLLTDDGTLIMEIPNSKSLARAIFGSNWYAWDLPRHFYHFSPKTITKLIEKAGFSNITVNHLPKLNLFWSLTYCFKDSRFRSVIQNLEKNFIFKYLTKLLASFSALIKRSEIIFIRARK